LGAFGILCLYLRCRHAAIRLGGGVEKKKKKNSDLKKTLVHTPGPTAAAGS
jgi:hypothetical protein